MDAIYDLLPGDVALRGVDEAYAAKQLHRVPEMRVVDRAAFILERCRGRNVLNVGCASGPLHEAIAQVARRVRGVDKDPCTHGDCLRADLDDPWCPDLAALWRLPGVEVVILGEVVEHLCNPGFLLSRLRQYFPEATILLTVPNAFAAAGREWLKRGYLNVNKDHTAWYCPRTLQTLLEKCGYAAEEWYWYGGHPRWAEGIIAVAKAG